MTKTEQEAIGALIGGVYGEIAELHYAVEALIVVTDCLRENARSRMPIEYEVENNDYTTIA